MTRAAVSWIGDMMSVYKQSATKSWVSSKHSSRRSISNSWDSQRSSGSGKGKSIRPWDFKSGQKEEPLNREDSFTKTVQKVKEWKGIPHAKTNINVENLGVKDALDELIEDL